MTLNQIKSAIYALYLTNRYGFRMKSAPEADGFVKQRLEYSELLLSKLNIDVEIVGREKIDQGGQYLIVSNHRSIIDPLVVEIALKGKDIVSVWIAKKELFNSFFFGAFTRSARSILLDREDSKQMGSFFKDVGLAAQSVPLLADTDDGKRTFSRVRKALIPGLEAYIKYLAGCMSTKTAAAAAAPAKAKS